MVTWKRVYPPPTEFFGVGRRSRHFRPGPEATSDKTARGRLDRPQKPGMKKTSGTHKCFAPLSHKAPIRNGF